MSERVYSFRKTPSVLDLWAERNRFCRNNHILPGEHSLQPDSEKKQPGGYSGLGDIRKPYFIIMATRYTSGIRQPTGFVKKITVSSRFHSTSMVQSPEEINARRVWASSSH